MHLLYVDESGSTGERLDDPDQPVFTMGGLIVRDEGWRKTSAAVVAVIEDALGGRIQPGFELHAHELLAPNGAGPFVGWEFDQRSGLALQLLDLLATRKHQVLLQRYDKTKLTDTGPPAPKSSFTWSDPWELGFAVVLTMFEEFLRGPGTGSSSTGLVIIDHHDHYLETLRDHCNLRMNEKGWKQVRKVVEIGYSAASHANPMVQLTDLVAFTMRKHAEMTAGYKPGWPLAAQEFFSECYSRVWPRVEYKALSPYRRLERLTRSSRISRPFACSGCECSMMLSYSTSVILVTCRPSCPGGQRSPAKVTPLR